MMKLHAIQTGSVRIKTAQVEGRGRGLRRRLAVFADRQWSEWLPTHAWAIEHAEGVIVVDTGQGAHLLDSGKFSPEFCSNVLLPDPGGPITTYQGNA